MKKIIFFNLVLALTAFGLVGCNNSNTTVANANRMNSGTMANSSMNNSMNSSMNSSMNNELSSADKEFMNKAAQSGMAEVALGKMAADKAKAPEVKAFGQRMVTDHSKANDDLKAVAAKLNVTLPTEVNSEQKEMMDKLSKLSGADFDKEYVPGMVEDHEKDVADFQKQSESASNGDVKAFAANTLPTLKSHLEQIKSIHDKMK
ncbi:MAG: DUF4142 domain-containing protein [Pyrinomonadaceae bacterium]